MAKINLKDLWIGDKLRIIDSGEVGSFEGTIQDLAIVKVNQNTYQIAVENIELYKEEDKPELLFFNDEDESIHYSNSTKKNKTIQKTIDLHIEKLEPSITNSNAMIILETQLRALDEFITQAISNQLTHVSVIHGKGEGKLKDYVHSYLDNKKEVRWKILFNKDGVTEVWFEYR